MLSLANKCETKVRHCKVLTNNINFQLNLPLHKPGFENVYVKFNCITFILLLIICSETL